MKRIQPSIGYRWNDGGRRAAGFRGDAGDCVARAMAIVTGREYGECYKALANANASLGRPRSARNGVLKKAYEKVFEEFGLVKFTLKRGKGTSLPTFAEAHMDYGDCIVTTTKHVCAIVGGKLHDTRDCRYYLWGPQLEVKARKAHTVYAMAEHTLQTRSR